MLCSQGGVLRDSPCRNQVAPMIWVAHGKFYPTELFVSCNAMFISYVCQIVHF